MDEQTEETPANNITVESANPVAVVDRPHSLAKLLYNHNPFYLVSALLIIYGCQDVAIRSGAVLTKSLAMTGGIAAYSILMAAICVAVVRLAKIWEDARSILIVVLLSLSALTTGFDELCISDSSTAIAFGGVAAALVLILCESILLGCRIRLKLCYRVALYAHYAVLIGAPVILGRAVAQRNDTLANAGSLLFSCAVATALLFLIPAMRHGPLSVRRNGTPWQWPLFPLSGFIVLLVLAGIRSHAIWISFGFYGTTGKFEPFLLMPILASGVLLLAETSIGLKSKSMQNGLRFAPPTLMLCGLSNHGGTFLPIRNELQTLFGSSLTACLSVSILLYVWMSLRGIRNASFGLPVLLLIAAIAAPLPQWLVAAGFESWMLGLLAAMVTVVLTLRRGNLDWMWTIVAGMVALSIALAGRAYGEQTSGFIAAMIFSGVSMLLIGALFETRLATTLRQLAALVMTLSMVFVLSENLSDARLIYGTTAASVCASSLVYGWFIRRRGWLLAGMFQLLMLLTVMSYQGHRSGQLRRINWSIVSGVGCLFVGVLITTGKTGLYQRLLESRAEHRTSHFLPGL